MYVWIVKLKTKNNVEIPLESKYNQHKINNVTFIDNPKSPYSSSMDRVTIPDGVTEIPSYALDNFVYLNRVSIPNSVTKINNFAFSGCRNLSTINIPENVTNIGVESFKGCTAIRNLIIPDTIERIGTNAFKNVQHIEYNGNLTGAPWGANSMN